MEINLIAPMFKALGDPTRLKIFQMLRECGAQVTVDESGEVRPIQGATVGEVCCSVTGDAHVTSTISFHLKELRNADLVTSERRGKHMICRINPVAVDLLVKSLTSRCDGCAGAETSCCEQPE